MGSHNDSVLMWTFKPCISAIENCPPESTIAFCAERDVQVLRKFAAFWQANRGYECVRVTVLQTIIHSAPTSRRAYNLNGLCSCDPIAWNGTAKVQALFVELLKDQHPTHQQRYGLLCWDAKQCTAARDA